MERAWSCHGGGSRRPAWTWKFRGHDGRQDYEPRTDHGHRAARPGEGDRQRGPLRGAGVCPAVGLAEVTARRQHAHPDRPQDRRDARLRPQARSSPRSPIPSSRSASTRPRRLNPEAELDDELELEQERPPQDFGRIAAQTAKQVILQKVRDAEREGIYSEFAGKEGQILRGGRAPHREAQRDPRDRQGRGDPARARADPGRALQPRRPHPRLRARGAPHRPRGRRSRCRGRTPATSRGCSRPRSPRSRRGSWS